MKKNKATDLPPTKFKSENFIEIDGFTISKGDIIKISGEHGLKFKFSAFTTNTETGSSWIDCFELDRGAACSMRSFYVDRVKRIPKKRGKRVSRRSASTTS